ncbi:hypothetical protein BH11MYX2_BH11MYX2_33840 [soil metagenome]
MQRVRRVVLPLHHGARALRTRERAALRHVPPRKSGRLTGIGAHRGRGCFRRLGSVCRPTHRRSCSSLTRSRPGRRLTRLAYWRATIESRKDLATTTSSFATGNASAGIARASARAQREQDERRAKRTLTELLAEAISRDDERFGYEVLVRARTESPSALRDAIAFLFQGPASPARSSATTRYVTSHSRACRPWGPTGTSAPSGCARCAVDRGWPRS